MKVMLYRKGFWASIDESRCIEEELEEEGKEDEKTTSLKMFVSDHDSFHVHVSVNVVESVCLCLKRAQLMHCP